MTATATAPPAARAAREALSARSRGRRAHGASLGQRLESLYTAALAAVVLGSMAVSGTGEVLSGGSCSTGGRCLDPAGRPALALAVALVGAGLLVRAASLAGPVATTRAEAAWLMSTPADRRVLLLPALVRALAAAVVAGGLLGWLVLLAASPGSASGARLAAAVVIGAAVVVAAVAGTAAGQARARGGRSTTVLARAAVVLGAACAVAALVPLDLLGRRPPAPSGAALGAVATAAAVLAAGATALALRGVAHVPLRELRSAGDVQAAVHTSAVALDARLAGSALDARRLRRGRLPSWRGAGTGLAAVVLRDLQRLARRPVLLVRAAALVLGPALALALVGPLLALVVAVVLAISVARSAAGGLRAVSGSTGLLRSFPLTTPQLRSGLLVGPLVLVLAWSAAVTPLLGLPPQAVPALALAGTCGAARALAAAGSGSGPMVMTGAGPVPLGLLAQLVRGPDVALVAAAPLLLGAGAELAVAVPLAVLALVVGVQGRRT